MKTKITHLTSVHPRYDTGIKEAVKLNKDKLLINFKKLKTIYNWEEQKKVLLQVYKDLDSCVE